MDFRGFSWLNYRALHAVKWLTKSGSFTVFTIFRLLTDFVCLYNYEFWLALCKIVRSSLILLLPILTIVIFSNYIRKKWTNYLYIVSILCLFGIFWKVIMLPVAFNYFRAWHNIIVVKYTWKWNNSIKPRIFINGIKTQKTTLRTISKSIIRIVER